VNSPDIISAPFSSKKLIVYLFGSIFHVRARLEVIVPSATAVSKSNPVSAHPVSVYHVKWYQVESSTSEASQSMAHITCPDVRGSAVKSIPVLTTFSPDSTLRVKVLETIPSARSSLKQRTAKP
jgi:hypothetical protein